MTRTGVFFAIAGLYSLKVWWDTGVWYAPLPLASIFIAFGAGWWWAVRDLPPWRLKHGLCIQCAYNLKGNVSGVCPECGLPIEKDATAS